MASSILRWNQKTSFSRFANLFTTSENVAFRGFLHAESLIELTAPASKERFSQDSHEEGRGTAELVPLHLPWDLSGFRRTEF